MMFSRAGSTLLMHRNVEPVLCSTHNIVALPAAALSAMRQTSACHWTGRATQLRPGDARMWCAMGQCYEDEQLGMDDDAMRAYRRAMTSGEHENIARKKMVRALPFQPGRMFCCLACMPVPQIDHVRILQAVSGCGKIPGRCSASNH